MKDRLGFVSLPGALTAGAVLLAIGGWTALAGPAPFSPGSLNGVAGRPLGGVTSHAQLTSCGSCHTAFWEAQTMADRCIACHADIGQQIGSRSGLHGRLTAVVASPTCRGCHTDHRGPSGALTVTDASFPHDLTGYSLAGHRQTLAGAAVTCAGCHPDGLATFREPTCTACHRTIDAAFMQRHFADFGERCLSCHDGSGRNGFDFDHDKLPFKLIGKHAGVPCARCHGSARAPQEFKNAPTDCYSCHAASDRHQGAFGRDCGSCHTPAGWANATFDHSAFPLDHGSSEQRATCKTCHPTDVSTYTCFGCHRHTPANVQAGHEGRALADIANCVQCHQGGRGGGD